MVIVNSLVSLVGVDFKPLLDLVLLRPLLQFLTMVLQVLQLVLLSLEKHHLNRLDI